MKPFFKASIFLGICTFLIACGQSLTPAAATTPSLTTTTTATIIPLPSKTSTPIITPTDRPEYVPPTLVPTIDPTLVPEVLSKSLSIQTIEGVNRHDIRQITGWDYGFRQFYQCRSYQWLDSDHLLLYPRVGQEINSFMGTREDLAPQPVVIDLKTGHLWLPQTNEFTWAGKCDSVYWSQSLGLLITTGITISPDGTSGARDAVFTYTFDGEDVAYYRGKLLGVSPSRTKIVVDNASIIDLQTGKTTNLTWNINYDFDYAPRIYWTSDETRLYRCCYHFANTSTGESYSFTKDEFQGTGGKPSDNPAHSYGDWVRNDDYFLMEWSVVDNGYPDFFPMFDPATKKYFEVSEMAGVPADWTCVETTVAPDGIYVWLECWEGSYLINLETFDSTAYPNFAVDDIVWSGDGKFAWVEVLNTELHQILSVTSKEIISLSVDSDSTFDMPLWWHPTENIVAYISGDAQKLELLDAQTMFLQEINLPTTFKELVWNPGGDRIALVAQDGSLWQIDYPKLENLEQLSEPITDLRDVFWSPDGNSIAFVGDTEINIVETIKK